MILLNESIKAIIIRFEEKGKNNGGKGDNDKENREFFSYWKLSSGIMKAGRLFSCCQYLGPMIRVRQASC